MKQNITHWKRIVSRATAFMSAVLMCAGASLSAAQSTNYTDLWWGGAAESGWGIHIAHHGDQIFSTWYTYDTDGSQLFVTLSGCNLSPGGKFNGTVCEGDLYRTTGTPITAATFVSANTTLSKMGTGKLSFTGPNAATFNYKIGAVNITKSLERFGFGTGVGDYPRDSSDIYYQADASGWGYSLAQHGNVYVGVIYHYDESGKPLFALLSNGQQQGATVSGALTTTRSAGSNYTSTTWKPSDISNVGGAPIGQASFSPNATGFALTFSYKGTSQTRQMTRLPFGSDPAPQPDIAKATPQEASRFLGQATFGANDAQIARVRALGYEGWLNEQFATSRGAGYFDTMLARGYAADETYKFGTSPIVNATLYTAYVNAPDQLRKRVGLALSEIMVIGLSGINANYRVFGAASYFDTLEANAFGTFRELIDGISRHPAMGVYLTFRNNVKADPVKGSLPDENYARELMQLFTIGLYELNLDGTLKLDAKGDPIETYTQNDITELAKVFTGWRWVNFTNANSTDLRYWNTPMAITAPTTQSLEAKNFLGLSIPAGVGSEESLKRALDHIANHPNVAPFISKQLIQRLVSSNPSPAYVSRVATVFNNNGSGARGDLRAVTRAILLDPEARDAANLSSNTAGKVREPIIRLMHWARAFNAQSTDGRWNFGILSDPGIRLGQDVLRAPSVFNFYRPGYSPPNTTIAQANLLAPEFQITTETSVVGYVNYMQQVVQGTTPGATAPMTATYANELALVNNIDALIDRVALLLSAGNLSAETRALIKHAAESFTAGTQADQLNRVRTVVLMVLASPDYIVQR
jgi:uncharacterized protein (DUF1800 family)